MVTLSTTYDSTIKEKVFVVKGEEAYAKTTDTLLNEILYDGERRSDWNHFIKYMQIELEVDVLRDVEASSIVLYDNDEVLGVYEYTQGQEPIRFVYNSDPTLDTRLKLDYDVEHNIYAKYMGNKKCLKSQSAPLCINEPTPDAYVSELQFEGLNNNYNSGSTFSFNIKLLADDFYRDQTILVYDGSTLIRTLTTNASGRVTVSNLRLSDGLHNIYVKFEGSDELGACELLHPVSVGYVLEIVDYSNPIINDTNNQNHIDVKLTDHFNNPISNAEIELLVDVDVSFSSQVTNDNGIATFEFLTAGYGVNQINPIANYAGNYSDDYYDKVSIPVVDINYIDMSATPRLVSSGNISTITTTITPNLPNVPVYVNGILHTTDANGQVKVLYQGEGAGDVRYESICGYCETHLNIEDLVAYWDGAVTANEKYGYYGQFAKQSNTYKLTVNNKYGNTSYVWILDDRLYSSNWEVEYVCLSKTNGLNFGIEALRRDGIPFGTSSNINLKKGDVIANTFENGIFKIYRNNSLVVEKDLSIAYDPHGIPLINIYGNDKAYMIFDKVKVKTL